MSTHEKVIKSILEPVISIIKSQPNAQVLIDQWINGKYGKIIGWKIRTPNWEENYHLIFTTEDTRLNVGEYPAFDILFIGNADTILSLLKGEKRIDKELKEKTIMVWGNLNEGIMFQKILYKLRNL
ncbi:MAG: hypothetical protein ACTSQI_10920 [Candidatus Helarchaeota archaeon]